jgi:hypothetical protein
MSPSDCAFCGAKGEMTREHVLPQWLRRALDGHSSVTPARGRHLFGGDLVIDDVCGPCNSGPLSRLDETAKQYWDLEHDRSPSLAAAEANLMARWAAKVCFNAQRAVMALGTAGSEPRMPVSVRDWVLRGGKCPDDLAVSTARLPTTHPDSQSVGLFGSNGTILPRRYLQLRAGVFFTAWSFPEGTDAAQLVAKFDREKAPASAIGDCTEDVGVPELRDPDMVRRGYWNNEELVERVNRRFGD